MTALYNATDQHQLMHGALWYQRLIEGVLRSVTTLKKDVAATIWGVLFCFDSCCLNQAPQYSSIKNIF